MKILFAIQGTGNGHLSRAQEIYPELVNYGEVDVLVSGTQADIDFGFPVKFKLHGVSFIFGKNGGVDILQTALKLRFFRFIRDVKELPVEKYDLVINDFEPISAWASKIKGIPCIALSHQFALYRQNLSKTVRFNLLDNMILKYYAPFTKGYGFDFEARDENIFPPVIRRQVRTMTIADARRYTVYLPAYDDKKLLQCLSRFPNIQWEVFSKHNRMPVTEKNISVRPLENEAFIRSMASSSGIICGAGFETSAEALYLGKKLLVVPMRAQYEQRYNACVLKKMGTTTIRRLNAQNHAAIQEWLEHGKPVRVAFPDMTAQIVKTILSD